VTRDGRVRVEAPASTANLGVGFDALSAPIWGLLDRVEARLDPRTEGVTVEAVEGPYREGVPHSPANTAAIAAAEAARLGGWEGRPGIVLRVWKGVPPGMGLGSSGASAAAGALAADRLLGLGLSRGELVRAAGQAEARYAGTPHYDNVAASITGEVSVVAVHKDRIILYTLRDPPQIMVALPRVRVPEQKTRLMRSVLPETIPFGKAVGQWQRLAALVAALQAGDWEAAGLLIMSDEIVEPARAPYVPCYHEAKEAALRAGAYAAFISGAGPSMGFLVADRDPGPVEEAVRAAYKRCGLTVGIVYSRPPGQGVG